jgi:uncharacterized protein (TIGR02145 family)
LKAKSSWNNNGNGTDNFVFSALAGGLRTSDGEFGVIGEYGYWWTDEEHGDKAYGRLMYDVNAYFFEFDGDKNSGLSVRCVADN